MSKKVAYSAAMNSVNNKNYCSYENKSLSLQLSIAVSHASLMIVSCNFAFHLAISVLASCYSIISFFYKFDISHLCVVVSAHRRILGMASVVCV